MSEPTPGPSVPSFGRGARASSTSTRAAPPQGVQAVSDRLAPPAAGSARAAVLALLPRHGLSVGYPPAVEQEAAAWLARPGLDDGVVDRTALPFVTIDNADSRDLDQAMCIEPAAGGGWTVYYALADASYYVRPGSALLEHGLARGTSYYLPGMSVPMLPPSLSEGLVSLNPRVERRALLFVLSVAPDGEARETRVERARIRSRKKLSYPGVQAFHDGARAGQALAGHDYTPTLELLREVGEARLAEAKRRGVVEVERQELEVELDPKDPARFVVAVRGRSDVDRWNEQLSLLTNTEGAALFTRADPALAAELQPIFRTHPAPQKDDLDRLERTVDALLRAASSGPAKVDAGAWRWRRDQGESVEAWLKRLPRDRATARLREGVVRQALYASQPSAFTSGAGPHHALGVSAYARFSAPMREVVGIFTHKEGLERLGLAPPSARADDDALRQRAIASANQAKKRQGALTKDVHALVIDQALRPDLALPRERRPRRPGTLLGVAEHRVFVELDGFPLELKVYREDVEASHGAPYRVTPDASALAPGRDDPRLPTFRVGDGVTVLVEGQEGPRWRLRLESLR